MDQAVSSAAPRWFTVAAIAALLWEMAGCVIYLMQVSVDPAQLPPDQRAMWDAAPTWMIGAFAIAVWVGLTGAIFLVMRRRQAAMLLAISLVAVIVQYSALLVVPQLRNQTTPDDLVLPGVILLVAIGLVYLARRALHSAWLR